jgi:predicted DCC family thiol-disulfide oxidoreductase YuxK
MTMTEQMKEIAKAGHPLLLFDGPCNLCSSLVQFVIRRDRAAKFRFASLDSQIGTAIRAQYEAMKRQKAGDEPKDAAAANEVSGEVPADTFLLVRGERIYSKSRAALEVAKLLGGVWPLLYALIVVPAPLRDALYNWVARNRYRWFGKSDSCMMPTPETRARFMD